MARTTGSRYFAEVIKGYGITHAFFVPTILMEALGIQKILTHGEKAEAMGCAACRVETPAQLRELLPKAMAMNRPVLLDVIGDDTALALGAWTPGGAGGH